MFKFSCKHHLIYIILFFFLSACDSGGVKDLIPEYIKLEDSVYKKSEFLNGCSTSIYQINIDDQEKNINLNNDWVKTPISRTIIDGLSVKSKTLLAGSSCGGGLSEYDDIFWESIEQDYNYYMYLGDNNLLIFLSQKKLLITFSVD